MKTRLLLIAALSGALTAAVATATPVESASGPVAAKPEHSCRQPAIPTVESKEAERQAFPALARSYHDCIDAYMEQQRQTMKLAQERGNAAGAEYRAWAEVVNTSKITVGQTKQKPRDPDGVKMNAKQ